VLVCKITVNNARVGVGMAKVWGKACVAISPVPGSPSPYIVVIVYVLDIHQFVSVKSCVCCPINVAVQSFSAVASTKC